VFRTLQALSTLLILSFIAMYTVFYFSTRGKKHKRVRPNNDIELNETTNQLH